MTSSSLPNGNASSKTESNTLTKQDWAYSRVELYLENIILPGDKISPSPSEKDGLDSQSEYDLRFIGCELIQTAGILLKLPQVAMATAQVLFQRFYYFKSFVNNPMEIFAMASLVLASKIEEAVRRNRDIVNVFHYLKYKRANLTPEPLMLDGNYQYIKSQVIKAERKLLRELGFCVHIKHPHKLITCFLQALGCDRRRVRQTAWNYMNDGLRTNIFVRFSPETIACACIYLSARQHKVALPMNPPWYEVFKCTEEQLNDIAFNILNVYIHEAQSKEKLEEIIQRLKDQLIEAKAKAKTESTSSVVSSTLSGVPNSSSVSATNPSAVIASAQRHNNNNSITNTTAAAHVMSSARRGGSHSNHQSPNSRNSSPSSKDHRKDKENRKRISPPVDSGDDLSPSDNQKGGHRSYHHHHHHKHKHQKKKSKSKDMNKYYHRKDKDYSYYSQSSLPEWGDGKSNGSGGPRKQKNYNRASPNSFDDNSIPPVKRSRKGDKGDAGDMMTSSHSEDSSPEQVEQPHKGGGKKHKRKSSREGGGGAKHKSSRSNKASYKERNTRYY